VALGFPGFFVSHRLFSISLHGTRRYFILILARRKMVCELAAFAVLAVLFCPGLGSPSAGSGSLIVVLEYLWLRVAYHDTVAVFT
jgi:hypothetical protein